MNGAENLHHRIVIVGGGSAGISVAARLRRRGEDDVAVIEPAATHFYQPLWTLVGAGEAQVDKTARPEASVMPKGVRWLQEEAEDIDAPNRVITTRSGVKVGYDYLVVCPGIQLDWDDIPGMASAVGHDGVSSNYRFDLAPRTWQFISEFKGGTALFTMPAGPIKCAGAPQKIAYMAADHFRRQGISNARVIFATPLGGIFGVPEYAAALEDVIADYGIEVLYQHELIEVRPESRQAVLAVRGEGGGSTVTIDYDLMHVTPPQSAPDFVKKSALAVPGEPKGWVQVDQGTMRHPEYPEVFALGDASSSPNSKTGAAVRKQAPVVTENLLAAMEGREPTATYDGYSACPIVTGRGKMLLAEFDYSMRPTPTIPFIDTTHPRRDMWYLKKYGLPFLYWNLMLRGLDR